MKLLVVSLALAIFSGSQAFVLRDESKSEVEELQRELSQNVEELLWTVVRKWMMVADSEIGKVLESWTSDMTEKAEQRLQVLRDAFPPEVEQARRQATSAYNTVERKLANEWRAFKRNVAPETKAFEQALESDLNPVLENLRPYLQPLRESLVQSFAGLNKKLTEMLKPMLEKLQPSAEKVQEQLQEVEDALDPIVGHVQKYLVSEVEGAREVLQRSAARVLEVFNKHREGFDRWVQTPLLSEKHGEQ